jgi:hypothetical protein
MAIEIRFQGIVVRMIANKIKEDEKCLLIKKNTITYNFQPLFLQKSSINSGFSPILTLLTKLITPIHTYLILIMPP